MSLLGFGKKKGASGEGHEPNQLEILAICRDCGTLKPADSDRTLCSCGGTYHVDSARCVACGGRHAFGHVGEKCACGGKILPKAVSCPSCGHFASHEHLGEFCPDCNVELKLEG